MLGKGGMGEVYRASDTKLGRDVAIKILPTELSGDPERTARFEREARTLASLQHPNVASIYGFEEAEGTRFLIMEFVDGVELTTRITEGALALDEVTRIGRQIATGLEAAHERGIVHRDLKPANIMLSDSGDVKILDFGLARAWFGDAGDDGDLSQSPTITAAMTAAGTILGTAAYMSPEQARGRNVDRRADIWAFGAILWEMVTGERLFEGETVSDTLAAVLRAEPDWKKLPVDDAPQLCRLIERCLVRDPQQRLRDIGEARILLDGGTDSSLLSYPAMAGVDTDATASRSSGRVGWFAAVAMTVVAAILATMFFTRDEGPRLSQTTLGLRKGEAINFARGGDWSSLQFSPDGSFVIYVGGRPGSIHIRNINSFESTKLADTQGAVLPVISPDGRWIAYFDQSKLWKVAISGGAPVEICDTQNGPGLAWGNGELYFPLTNGGGLWAVSENGGEVRAISTLDEGGDETSHRWPHVLPDGKHLLITIKTKRIDSFDDASIGLLSLETGDVTVLLKGGANPGYVSTGHIVYGRDFQLFAVPFDLNTLSIQGTPVPCLDGVHVGAMTGSAHYALNPQGHMVYLPSVTDYWDFELMWLDRTGKTRAIDVDQSNGLDAILSPLSDDRFAAVLLAANDKIWLYDLKHKSTSRLSNTPGNDRDPVWSPDGEQIAYRNDQSGSYDLYVIATDGSAPAQLVLASEFEDYPASWSPDGSRLLFTRVRPDGNADIWGVDMTGTREASPFLETQYNEGLARFSPDGSWVAYMSNSSGERDIYVRPYPGPGKAIRISTSGGSGPVWSRDGNALYYTIDQQLMEVPIDGKSGFVAGEPKELLALPEGVNGVFGKVSPSLDGERFLCTRANLEAGTQIRVIFDWTERLKDITPSQ